MKKQPTAPSIAEFYHEITKYSQEKLSPGTLDPRERPPLFKDYLSERTVDLKPYLKGLEEGQPAGPAPLRAISRILYHTGGITSILEGQGGTAYFRAAPSAGALYPVEIYLATRKVEGLSDGIHSYSVREHALVPIWDGDFGAELEQFCFRHAAALRARMFLIFTGVFRRGSWRYGDRAYRRILLDLGHMVGNAVLYAAGEKLRPVPIGGFHDAAVSDLLFLDREEEGVLLLAPLVPEGEAGAFPSTPVFPGASARNPPPAGTGDKGVMLLLHERSGIAPRLRLEEQSPRGPQPRGAAEGAPTPRGAAVTLGTADGGKTLAAALAASAGQLIRRRRSTRSFSATSIRFGALSEILAAAYAPARACLLDASMISTHVVATRVEGLPAGVYLLDGENLGLVPRRKGDFQTELWNLCLGQELGRDAAAAVVHVADLPACVERYGDRAYRYLHVDAGHLGERINLAAIARKVGVSGIGGFFDEEVNALLDLPEQVSTLYITLLGHPGQREKRE